jgi:hypothetical protein
MPAQTGDVEVDPMVQTPAVHGDQGTGRRPATSAGLSMAWLLVAVVVSLLVPFAALVVGPALIVHGVHVLRRVDDPAGRAVAWAELAAGLIMLSLTALAIVGLMAVGAGGSAVEGPIVVVSP